MIEDKTLQSLARQIEICHKCDLYKSANHAVAGEGSASAKIIFIGEAPGFNEDIQGRPFVGNAGKYLDLLISKIGLKRGDVFITNVIKHRPPENRDPTLLEIAACNGWLDEQLLVISPKIVVTLGKWSLGRFLPSKKISEVHGKPIRTKEIIVIPMYHPAAALRSNKISSELEEDFLKNKELLQNPDQADNAESLDGDEAQGSLF